MRRPSSGLARALALLVACVSPLGAQQPDSSGAQVVITVDSLDRAAFANVAELLQARVPGLHISRTGDGGLRWFMRGPSSVSEGHPMVLVDDVRINVAGSAMPETGTRPPLLDEFDLEEVERIEVWSGAATTARFGTGAGNGVIRIVTRVPRGGRTTFRVATAAGLIDENVTYPANFTRPGLDTTGRTVRCTLVGEATQQCTPTGPPTSINVLETDSPFETALTARVAASLVSGTERLAWRGATTFDRQGSTTGALASQRLHLRGAAALRPARLTKLRLGGYWTRGHADLPPRNEQSLLWQGLFARADTAWPGFREPHLPVYQSTRYGGTLNGHWQPRGWLNASLTTGIGRMVDEDDQEYTIPPRSDFPAFEIDRRGERRRRDWNARLGVEARYTAIGLHHATIITVEHAVSKHEEEFRSLFNGGAAGFTAFGMNRRTAIAGVGLTQHVQLTERVTLLGGVRLDQVRVNDDRWDVPLSRHVSVAWDAPSFRGPGHLRLRASLGDVANVPMTTRLFFPSGGPGRPTAEFTREREIGFDATALENRVATSFSWYIKRTTDVGNLRELSTFPGGTPERIEVLNRGIEASVHARIVQTPRLSWEMRAWYAYNHNEATRASHTRLALDRVEFGPITFSNRQGIRPGTPLGAVFSRPLVDLQDIDGDGRVDSMCFDSDPPCEVVVAQAIDFLPVYPPTSVSLATSLRLGRLTLSALLDHRSGHVLYNATMERRCFRECQGLYNPSVSFRDQAEALMAFTSAGMIEDASYTKLREISLRFEAPATWSRALGASRLEASIAARNVATWTDYGGLDPESTSQYWIPLTAIDHAAEPLPRRVSVRLTVTK